MKPIKKESSSILTKEEAEAAVARMTDFRDRIIQMFSDAGADINEALASTFLAAVALSRHAGAERGRYMMEAKAAWDNTAEQKRVIVPDGFH